MAIEYGSGGGKKPRWHGRSDENEIEESMDHEELVEAAKEAIDKVFSDTEVPQSQTKESLMELYSEIKQCLEALED